MTIIDAQVHIWGADTPERPWPAYGHGYAHRGGKPFGKDELLREMDAADVDRVVIVPPSWEGDRNDLALEAASLHQHIRRVVEAFGRQRVFWGTDLTRLPCPYRQAVTLFTDELDFLSDTDKAWIMGRGIAAWLDWPLPQE